MSKILKIKANDKKGFRRAGIRFTTEWVEYPSDKFTPEQVAALKAEEHLSVVEIDKPTGKRD